MFRLLVSRDEYGALPLHIAAQHGHQEALHLLLQACPQAVRWGRERCRPVLRQSGRGERGVGLSSGSHVGERGVGLSSGSRVGEREV